MGIVHTSAATLGFYGDDLDPDEITTCLGVSPTIAVRKDGSWLTNQGTKKTAKTGSWRLEVDRCEPADLDGQIRQLLSFSPNAPEVWQSLAARYQGRIFVGLFLNSGNEGLTLQPSTLTMISDRGLTLDLDIYGHEPD